MSLLALLALLLPSMAAAPDAGAGRQSATATLVPAPAEVAVGQPIEFLLDVVHSAGARVRFPEKEAESRAWVRLSERSVTRAADPVDVERAHTIARWSSMVLEPGEPSPPALVLEVVEGSAVERLTVTALPVHVLPELAEGEDAPRPLLGFRDLPEDLEASGGAPWIAGGVLVAGALGLVLFLVARKKRPAPAIVETPLARLDALAERFESAPEDARDRVYDLVHLVRETVDRFLHEPRAAATDEVWSAAVAGDERLPLGVRHACTRLLAQAERIKYAAESPTRFAVDEYLKDARAALEALAEAERVREARAA